MIRRPPRSTLFPYRRSSDLVEYNPVNHPNQPRRMTENEGDEIVDSASGRSEEHTSELQSQFHLVCRLLLEKKKKKQKDAYNILHPTNCSPPSTIYHIIYTLQ